MEQCTASSLEEYYYGRRNTPPAEFPSSIKPNRLARAYQGLPDVLLLTRRPREVVRFPTFSGNEALANQRHRPDLIKALDCSKLDRPITKR